ncbi:MAG: acyl-[ACP]--phospholipid O-acyltransferase, partial [Nitrospirae bacterium]
LNYTAGREGMESALRQAGIRTLVTSRVFVQKAKLNLPPVETLVWLEDIRSHVSHADRAVAALLACCAPDSLLERIAGAPRTPRLDDLATIIFSSGSTGEPKGVMLTHANLVSNVDGVAQVFAFAPDDRMLGILPFFHSFGYLATIWLTGIHGVGVVYHPSPLDAGAIGRLVQRYRVTLLVTTPTFLQLYWKRCTPEQFASLRVVLTGAEKLPLRLAQAFEERFGIRPIEGYGVTECSPVIAVNRPCATSRPSTSCGFKEGTVGQPLPGVFVKIVDPESLHPVPTGCSGLLLVKGPNVMAGYLGREDLTAQAFADGWYITGDFAMLDDDGFLTITDRLFRFAKIGGEMVPHGVVEEALHQALGAETQVLAVTSIPDEKKGEQLVVLHTLDEAEIPDLLDKITARGLPPLFLPRKDAFLKVDQLPVLGTGKLDLRALKHIAMERMGKSRSPSC